MPLIAKSCSSTAEHDKAEYVLDSCTGTNTCPHPRPSPHLSSPSPPHSHYYFQHCHHPRHIPVAFIPVPASSPQQSFPSPTVPADDCSHASPQNHRHISNKIEKWKSGNNINIINSYKTAHSSTKSQTVQCNVQNSSYQFTHGQQSTLLFLHGLKLSELLTQQFT